MYKQDKDKLIKLFEKIDGQSSLLLSVMSYNNGPKKLQISRNYVKPDGTATYSAPGRLTLVEVEWLKENLIPIIQNMKD